MNKKKLSKALNGIYIFIVLFFLFDALTSFEIKNQIIRWFIYFGMLIYTPAILIWNLFYFKVKKRKFLHSILPIIVLIGIAINPMGLLFTSSNWKTQTVLYENGHLNFKKIEFQMRDYGSFGYGERTVDVLYLTNWFMIVNEIELDAERGSEWIKVDKEVNELKLK